MLKDLSGHSEDEFAPACGDAQEPLPQHPGETHSARFRTSLWLGIAADIRRYRASQEMKGLVSC